MGRGRKLGTAGIAIATAVAGSGAGLAQVAESNSSPVVTLDASTELRADTNKDLDPISPGTTTTASEILSLMVLSETNSQVLSFSGSGSLQFKDDPIFGTSTGFVDPSVRLLYSREAANAAFSVSGFYRESDINDSLFDENLRPQDLIAGPGTLQRYGGDIELSYGIQSPVGFTIYARTDVRNYQNTINPDLNDSTQDEYGASLDLRFSPVTQVSLNTDWNDYHQDRPNAFDRNETSYSASVSHDLSAARTIKGELGYTKGETTEIGEAPDYDNIFGSLDFRQEVTNGAYTGGVSFELRSDNPDRFWLDFGREMELPTGALAFALTLTRTDSSDLQLLGSVDYTQELKSGILSLYFNQEITTNTNNNDEQLSRLLVDYQHQINTVSSFTLAMDVSRTKDAGTGTIDGRTRADLSATYSHELTADWNLNLGYERRQYDEFGGDKAESDAVFMTLTRGFSLGF